MGAARNGTGWWAAVVLPAVGLLLACGDRPAPSVVLVSIDTCRADHLGFYGYGRDTSPGLDSLAMEGLVFEQAVTVSPNTLISHASLLTGLFSEAHGATPEGQDVPIDSSYQTLAEDFRSAGYQTAGFVAHGDWLNARYGFDQGFDEFTSAYRGADEVLTEARAWLAARDPRKPFFLFLHLYDVHSDWVARPYDAPPPFRGRYTSWYDGNLLPWEERTSAASPFLIAVTQGEIAIDDEDVAYIRDQYDEGLAYADDRLARFLEECRKDADPFFLVTADHGEEFREHGAMLHTTLYDPVVRVPLLILIPRSWGKRWGSPRRISEQVRFVDLRPTLSALAGITSPRECQGVDLGPWLQGLLDRCPAGPAPLYHGLALRAGGFKLMKSGNEWRLFDLRLDPGELSDVSGSPELRGKVDEMKAALETQVARSGEIRARHFPAAGPDELPVDSGAIERLRSLGYLR